MYGPGATVRHRIADRLHEVILSGDEKLLEELLTDIAQGIESDIDHQKLQTEDPRGLLTAVESWASVASETVTRFYSECGPRPPKHVGCAPAAANLLRQMADQLRPPLGHAAKELGAASYSISVGAPSVPLSVTLTWLVAPRIP
ncbi:MAG TPA: hypothetical protein VFU43_27895 [Streptosporangiaceae bacterium]|nr:hypothetical protein [Streptosporangiaceae bacterium]